MILRPPARLRLADPDATADLEHRLDFARKRAPLGSLLLDVPQPRLTPRPPRRYGRNPGKLRDVE